VAILEPTLRKEGSQFWLIFNPMLSSDFVWRRFVLNPPPGTIKRIINYTENPFLSETMRRVIDAAKAEDEDEFTHVYLGVPRDDDEGALIKRSWIMAAIDAHKALGSSRAGRSQVGFDVADSGTDKCALVHAYGPLAMGRSVEGGRGRAAEVGDEGAAARLSAMRSSSTTASASGLASGAKVNELNTRARMSSTSGFNAGGGVERPDEIYARAHPPKTNKDMFANAKAQQWWMVADRFRNTFSAVKKGHLQLVIDELARQSATSIMRAR
jgi:phage terminase large subunit